MAGRRYAVARTVRASEVGPPGAASPLNSWTPGAPGHHRLSLPCGEARRPDSAIRWAPRSAVSAGRARRWRSSTRGAAGWTSTSGAWSPAWSRRDRMERVRKGGAHVRDDDRRPAGAGRLAGGGGGHPRGDGEHRASTGSRSGTCWKSSFELLLVNARHIKAVPGRKTDVRDCEWIADCCGTGCCGQLRARIGHSGSCAS